MTASDDLIMQYIVYCKFNPGLTYAEFLNEEAAVISTVLTVQSILAERENKRAKNQHKRNK